MTAPRATNLCDTCGYFDPLPAEPGKGLCRVSAPQPIYHPDTGKVTGAWPKCDRQDWCGQWQGVVATADGGDS